MNVWLRVGGPITLSVALVVAMAWLLLVLSNSDILPAFGVMTSMGAMDIETHWWLFVANICLMLFAMMLPLIASPLRHVYVQSLTQRRCLSVPAFAFGYFTLWFPVCLLLTLAQGKQSYQSGAYAALVAVALLWQCSPAKQKFLNRCHRFPTLSAIGPRAFSDAFTFGAQNGIWCLGSCLILMIVVISTPMNLVTMFAASAWMFAERFERPATPRWEFRFPQRFARAVYAYTILTADRVLSPLVMIFERGRRWRNDI